MGTIAPLKKRRKKRRKRRRRNKKSEVYVTGIIDMAHRLKLKHPQHFGEGACLHLQCGSR